MAHNSTRRGLRFESLPKVVKRRERDSNPRCPYEHNGFRDRPIKPLSHLSKIIQFLNHRLRFESLPKVVKRRERDSAYRRGLLPLLPARLRPLTAPSVAPHPPLGRRGLRFESLPKVVKRRERDSNPRCPHEHTRLPIVHLRPLGHLSMPGKSDANNRKYGSIV